MKRFRFIIPFFCGTLVYTALLMTVGPKGFLPMSHLQKEAETMKEHISSLRTMNEELAAQVKNLSANPDTIAVYAHELGYIAEGERLIKLSGFIGGIDRNLHPGTLITRVKPIFLEDWICKTAGIATGLMALAISIVYFLKKNQR
ncbi:MAG TPA: septum formation initiator family protein [Treponemataceae bacterium]|nr:septum formation initiator family protein [Treponemataceae bacterium]